MSWRASSISRRRRSKLMAGMGGKLPLRHQSFVSLVFAFERPAFRLGIRCREVSARCLHISPFERHFPLKELNFTHVLTDRFELWSQIRPPLGFVQVPCFQSEGHPVFDHKIGVQCLRSWFGYPRPKTVEPSQTVLKIAPGEECANQPQFRHDIHGSDFLQTLEVTTLVTRIECLQWVENGHSEEWFGNWKSPKKKGRPFRSAPFKPPACERPERI